MRFPHVRISPLGRASQSNSLSYLDVGQTRHMAGCITTDQLAGRYNPAWYHSILNSKGTFISFCLKWYIGPGGWVTRRETLETYLQLSQLDSATVYSKAAPGHLFVFHWLATLEAHIAPLRVHVDSPYRLGSWNALCRDIRDGFVRFENEPRIVDTVSVALFSIYE